MRRGRGLRTGGHGPRSRTVAALTGRRSIDTPTRSLPIISCVCPTNSFLIGTHRRPPTHHELSLPPPPVPLVARVVHATTAAYQRALINRRKRLYQQESQ